MMSTLIVKELKNILLSPKFTATFAVCSLLMLLSVFVGIREYQSAVRQYEAANELVKQEMREARQWMAVNNRVYREPDPLQIFVAGVQNDIGRYSGISSWQPVKLVHSAYSDDPIFAVFRFIDFAFIVQVVLSLFAILFTYDAVNGEREQGTLQLVFSNAVPRARYVAAKFIGLWSGLMIPLALPILLSVLLLFVFKIPMMTGHWLRLATLIVSSILLFTFFLAFGILISAATKRSNVSFLISLVSWVGLVLIVPRVGVMLAGQMVRVPTVAEVESQQDGFAKNRWDDHMKTTQTRWRLREESMQGLDQAARKAKRDEMEWTWAGEDEKDRKQIQVDIDENGRKLREEVRNKKLVQERLAFAISRISPVSAYQLAVMNLAETDVNIKGRYEDALNTYRTSFNQFKEKKAKESGNAGGLRISFDSNTGIKVDAGREMALDLSDVSPFQAARASFGEVLAGVVPDAGILGIFCLMAFAAAFLSFLRYDVR